MTSMAQPGRSSSQWIESATAIPCSVTTPPRPEKMMLGRDSSRLSSSTAWLSPRNTSDNASARPIAGKADGLMRWYINDDSLRDRHATPGTTTSEAKPAGTKSARFTIGHKLASKASSPFSRRISTKTIVDSILRMCCFGCEVCIDKHLGNCDGSADWGAAIDDIEPAIPESARDSLRCTGHLPAARCNSPPSQTRADRL